jgi:UDP-3-O-[3-hydroxymyristoyl] glucosamine N-acyltransferase
MVKITDILNGIPYTNYVGSKEAFVSIPAPLDVKNEDANILMWVNDANVSLLSDVGAGTIICGEAFTDYKNTCNYIIVERPRLAFKQVIEKFFLPASLPGISSTAQIHPTAIIGNMVTIGHHVVVEQNCVINNGCSIGHNTVLHANTQLGNDVKIGCNNTIGGVGFGYEKDIDGEYSLIPHIGNVVIEDNVEIGNNTCIDRAVLGSTILHENVKVDNLVHIAHGVSIGKNSLIIANAMVAGSTIIGENVWFAPSASVLNKRTIANNAIIGLGAVVVKNVNEGEVIVGNPGKPLTK